MIDFISRKHIALESIIFLIRAELLGAAVDINREECLCALHNKVATVLKSNGSTEAGLHLASDAKMVENRLIVFV